MPIPYIPDIWPIASVTDQPEISLRDWQVFEVQLPARASKTRHFVGYAIENNAGQVSSAIQSFDPKTMRGITESGRVYQLVGKPGWDSDGDHTWRRWKGICGITDELKVTELVMGLCPVTPRKPARRTKKPDSKI